MSARSEAEKWIDRLNAADGSAGGWRLETISKRSRKTASGVSKDVPIRIRRFARGIPAGFVKEALEYLLEGAPYTGIVYNGESLSGYYRPTSTTWVRDDQHAVGDRLAGTYTLVQDLVENSSDEGEEADTGNSCSSSETTTWVWDAASIGDLPSTGCDQGVTYSLQSVQRQEDGTFNYAIVKHTAKTIDSGMWSASECNAYETVYTRTWDNVYGSESSGFTGGGGCVSSVSIPDGCSGTPGTTYSRQITKNPDCTYRIVVQKRVSVRVSSEESSTRTSFEKDAQSVSRAESAKLGGAPAASGGVVTTHKSELRQDGRYDNTVSTKTEIPVTAASVETRKTLRAVSVTTVNRNQPSGASTSGMGVGDVVRNERTDGGLVNQTITRVKREDVGDVGSQCQTTVFEHQHSELRNEASRPEREASSSGGGKTYQVSSKQTEEGTWDVTRTTSTEIERRGFQHSMQKTLRGVTETIVDRNVADSSVSVLNVGDRVQVEMTPGGRYNRTVTKMSKTDVGSIGAECGKTVFEHRHSEQMNQSSAPSYDAGTAGNGVTVQKTVRRTEEGTWDVTTQTTTEVAQMGFQHEMRKTLRGVTETTVDRNVTDSTVSVSNVGDRVQVEMTPGGRYNRTVTKMSKTDVGSIGEACQRSPIVHMHSTTDNVSSKPTVERSVSTANTEVSSTARQTEEGTWDVETRETTYEEATAKASGGAVKATQQFESVRNATSMPTGTSPSQNKDVSVSGSMNDHGSYDYHKTTTNYKEAKALASGGSMKATQQFESVRNATSMPTWSPSTNQEVSVSGSMNDHGSYDYHKTTTTYVLDSATAVSDTPVGTMTTTVLANSTSSSVSASNGHASISMSGHGGYNTTKSEYSPKSVSSGWLTWVSTTKSPNSTLKYKHGIVVYRNQRAPIYPPSGASGKISCQINDYGLYDGNASYTQLVSWTDGSGSSGGYASGKVTSEMERYINGHKVSLDRTCQVKVWTGSMKPNASNLKNALAISSAGGAIIAYYELKEKIE